MPQVQPLYDPANGFTGLAAGTVTGGRLVQVSATKANGEPVKVVHGAADKHPIGVAGNDATTGKVVTIYPRQVLPCTASAGITAGAAVQAAADGKVATFSSGIKVGVALTTASADGDSILVQLQL